LIKMPPKRNRSTANLSPLTPYIHATTGQASDIRRKINTLNKISTNLIKLLDDTAAPEDIKNRFVSINNILGEFKEAVWLPQQQPQTKLGPRLMPTTPTKTTPAELISAKPAAVEPGPEEHQRMRSIVFIGLPENNSSTPSARQQADHITAVKLLDELGVEAAPSDCFRLGRFPNQAGSGPRLLRISLPSPNFKWAALGQWKKKRNTIRAMPGLDRLLIRPSMSAAQRSDEKRRTPPQSSRPAVQPEETQTTSNAQPEKEQEMSDVPPAGATQGSYPAWTKSNNIELTKALQAVYDSNLTTFKTLYNSKPIIY
jgi:hypothetical protein